VPEHLPNNGSESPRLPESRRFPGTGWVGISPSLGAGFLLVALVFCALSILLHRTGDSLARHSKQLLALDVRQEAGQRLRSRVQVAEIARAAYRATGAAEFAATARTELEGLPALLRTYREGQGDPPATGRSLGPLLEDYIRLASEDLAAPRSAGEVAPQDPVRPAADALNQALASVGREGSPGMQAGSVELQKASSRFLIGQRLQVPIGLLLLAGLFYLVVRSYRVRQHHESDLGKARDAALESVRLKAMFLANVSHELRTPMNGVIGMTGMLLETPLDARQRDYTETIRSCAMGLLAIVNDLLDFSKMEAGKMRFERRDFDLNATIELAVRFFNEQARGKGVDLQLAMARGAPTLLRGDPGRLRQVLSNLLNNALKFTASGTVRVEVDRSAEDSKSVELRFRVTDTGAGMSPETQRNLFQPFHQSEDAGARNRGGTGLGLAICKLLVEQMGGQISVRSTLGQGTTVEFTSRFERGVRPAEEEDTPVVRLDGEGMVLLVSSNPGNRRAMGRMLDSWNIRWAGVLGADAAREWAEKEGVGQLVKVILIDEDRTASALRSLDQMRKVTLLRGARSILVRPQIAGPRPASDDDSRFFAVLERPVPQSDLFDALATAWSARNEGAQGASSFEAGLDPLPNTGRILVAEDNPVNLKVTLHLLRRLGLHADSVTDGAQALSAYENGNYALILMDCRMPVMDGYEAAHQIRLRRGPNPPPAVIAVTAHAMQGDAEKCFAAGMDDYIAKPIDAARLHEKLKRWLTASPRITPPAGAGRVASALPTSSLGTDTVPLPANFAGEFEERGTDDFPLQSGVPSGLAELVDFDQFDAVLPPDPSERQEFLAFAWEELEGQKTALFRLLSNGDMEALSAAAHKLKGAAASLGLRSLAVALARIEANPEDAAGQGAGLDALWNQSRAALDAACART
jgi:signal transduction histidine kinase/CheY-like chemotaxis protein/HPt (histidine-containing phosphotransfer) domain-containing protein